MPLLNFQVYRVIAKIQDKEHYTYEDLAHELKMDKKTAYRHLKELWSLDLVYISGWDRSSQQWVPVYRWGNKPDAERPAAYSNAEKAARHREKQKCLQQSSVL